MLNPPLKVLTNIQIQTLLPQHSIRPRNATLHASRHHNQDPHIEGFEFETQGLRVGVQSGFGGVVDGAEDVGYYGGDGADVED